MKLNYITVLHQTESVLCGILTTVLGCEEGTMQDSAKMSKPKKNTNC